MHSIFAVVRRLYAFAGIKLWFNVINMAFVSLFAGAGTLLLIPLLNMSGFAAVNVQIPILADLTDGFLAMPPTIGLAVLMFTYAAVATIQHAIQRAVTIRNVALMQGFGQQMRWDTYGGVLRANWQFFLGCRKTDLVHSLTTELARVLYGTNLFLQLIASLVFTVIQIGIAFWFSFEMTAFVLLCGAILALASRKYIKRAKAIGSQTSELAQTYLAEVTDQLNGIKEIKSSNIEPQKWEWYRSLTTRMVKEQMDYIRLSTGTDFFYKTASVCFVAVFIFLSSSIFQTKLDQLLIIIAIFARLWPRFTGIQANLQQMASTIPAFLSVLKLQEDCKKAQEKQDDDKASVDGFRNEIRCRNVFFRYRENEGEYALQDINLRIPINGLTAIVGRSGAGKSTLVDLLMGLIKPESGTVSYDDIPLDQLNLKELRKNISYVPQDPYVFNGTIRDNLLLTNASAAEEEMWQALRFAAADGFVSKLPQGLDTKVGDRGTQLSGGERQRLVLARAVLRNPSILILDEATSALDTENEKKIQEALERLKGTMTVIVIAHRLSTIHNADQVLVLDEGRIVQSGHFHQLAADRQGLFNTLLGYQMKVAL